MLRTPLLAALAGAAIAGCLSRRVDFVPFLPPAADASLEELVARINDFAGISSLVLRVDLQFQTVEELEEGRGRRYRSAKGRLLLERPRFIRLNIEAPILSANIAEMASDGNRFQLLIHPAEYRALIEGSNAGAYREETAKLDADPDLKKAGPLVNIRPHHFTEAFLPSPIDSDTLTFLNEERVVEADLRPHAKKDAEVRKSYYVVTAVASGERSPRTQFWFDRLPEIVLARQRVFDKTGSLVTEIRYSDYLPPDPVSGRSFPSSVRIERPYDDYTLLLTVPPGGVDVNRDLPETAFVLTIPEEWGDSVKRIDLDRASLGTIGR